LFKHGVLMSENIPIKIDFINNKWKDVFGEIDGKS